jgi:hypothetical protein
MSIVISGLWDPWTSFNSRTSKTWVYMANHVEEKMVEDNVVTPEVHQCGGDVNPFPTYATAAMRQYGRRTCEVL